MLLAMGITAFLCIFIGIVPGPLYSILPAPVDYQPYTAAHVVDILQLLSFAVLAFCLLILSGLHPVETKVILLDADWFYRKGTKLFYRLASRVLGTDREEPQEVVHGYEKRNVPT